MEFLPHTDGLLSENAYKLFLDRYAKNGETSWEQLAKRVSHYVIRDNDEIRDSAFSEILSRRFLPNSPCLMNAGTDLAQLSACFVVPIQEDSMQGIYKAIGDIAEIQKAGGGTGTNFSILREKDSEVSTTKGKASGIVSFMKVFNASSKAVEQGGVRRGANMGIVDVNHPDLVDVIKYKSKVNGQIEQIKRLIADKDIDGELRNLLSDKKDLTYFNISINASEKFMKRVIKYVEEGEDSYWDFVSRKTGEVVKTEKISVLWNLIVSNAWSSGDPGIIFMDTINKFNPVPSMPIKSTNPCGEQPLGDYESCNLGSIDVSKFVGKDKKINYNELRKTIRTAVYFLDSVIDINFFPLPEIKKATQDNRKIGLGVMGVADMLYKMGLTYGSAEALLECEKVMGFINAEAEEYSCELGNLKGNFPNYEISIYISNMRNATRTTIAPTGSISILANCSSGIEPNFSLGYKRTIRETHSEGEYEIKVVNPVLIEELKKRNIYSEELIEKILNNYGSLKGLDEIPEDMKRVFITAFDVSVKDHLMTQAVFQKHCDNAVSKTINMPSNASIEDVSNTFISAFKLGLKGVTIYRDGSLDSQVLNNFKKEEENSESEFTEVKPRPVITDGYTVKLQSGCCEMNATIGLDEDGNLFETRISNSGAGCTAMYAGLGMMTSEALRLGGDPERIANQLRQVTCSACVSKDKVHGKSCPDILGKLIINALEGGKESVSEFVKDGKINRKKAEPKVEDEKQSLSSIYSVCESCGSKSYVMESGCGHCLECGYSKCKIS